MLSTLALLIPLFFLLPFTHANIRIKNTLYIISQAETPSLGIDGLTPIGLERAQTCIPNVFRDLNIGLIISCTPDFLTGACFAAVATVTPLANELNLTVNFSCNTGDNAQDDCVSGLIVDFAAKNDKAILAVWDAGDQDTFVDNLHHNLAIGLPDSKVYEGVFYHDIITTVTETSTSQTSQNCPDLDGKAPGTGDSSVTQQPEDLEP